MDLLTHFDDSYIINPSIKGRRGSPCYELDRSYNYACIICGKWSLTQNICEPNRKIAHVHTVKLSNTYYVIPKAKLHERCKELFELNPMSYEPELLYVPI